jgi:tetratricopeptide (TPR) repeat protein
VLALPVEDLTFEFDRARVIRLIGETYEAAGDTRRAQHHYRQALASWNSLASRAEFREPFLAEALIENGKLQWRLGHKENALTLLEEAIDLDPNGSATHTDVVSFLIVRDEYERALDAYHRALGSHNIGEYSKVYMSLWVIGEARRSGRREDPLALSYLSERKGPLWYDELARFASGHTGEARLSARATTRGRRAEMLFYTAMLGASRQDPVAMRALLRDVVASDMVMFFEYDMAKHWLERSSTAAARRRR